MLLLTPKNKNVCEASGVKMKFMRFVNIGRSLVERAEHASLESEVEV